jgi:hypothetical protein
MSLFSFRKKNTDFQRYMRRLIDLTGPIRACSTGTERLVTRTNRAVPTLICPWENDWPIVSQAIVAITKDLGDQGVAIVVDHSLDFQNVLLAFCHQEATAGEPWFFLGIQRSSVPLGGGFWMSGIELTEFINETWKAQIEPLVPLAKMLMPTAGQVFETSPPS